jgi:YD repeat-containing protein
VVGTKLGTSQLARAELSGLGNRRSVPDYPVLLNKKRCARLPDLPISEFCGPERTLFLYHPHISQQCPMRPFAHPRLIPLDADEPIMPHLMSSSIVKIVSKMVAPATLRPCHRGRRRINRRITMSDREQAGFRGPVKTRVEESIFSSQPMTRTTTEYRPDGMLLETCYDHGGGSTWVTAREYDSDGRLTKIKPANSDDSTSETIYVYDGAGRNLSITNTGNGDRTDFEYDDSGRKIGIQRFDSKALERSRSCAYAVSAWEAATSGAGIPLGGTIMTIYEADRPIEMQTRDSGGQILSRITRTYNAAGLLIEEKPTVENPGATFLIGFPPTARTSGMRRKCKP